MQHKFKLEDISAYPPNYLPPEACAGVPVLGSAVVSSYLLVKAIAISRTDKTTPF